VFKSGLFGGTAQRGVKILNPPLFFLLELLSIRIESPLDLVFTRRSGHRGRVLENDLHGEGPVGAAIAMIGRHERLHADKAASLDLFAEHGQMVAREERLKLLLETPFDAVEIPDCA